MGLALVHFQKYWLLSKMNFAVSLVLVAMLHATQRMTRAATKIHLLLDFTIHNLQKSKQQTFHFDFKFSVNLFLDTVHA